MLIYPVFPQQVKKRRARSQLEVVGAFRALLEDDHYEAMDSVAKGDSRRATSKSMVMIGTGKAR